jgi:prepilin-type N-terminal cleavage/methylation domain-containing protein
VNTNWEELEMDQEKKEEGGFTLIELLVAIVVVGILTAVAIVGIGGLTDTAHKASCQATLDASRASVAAYYAAQSPNTYPNTIDNLKLQNDITFQGGVTGTGTTIVSDGGTPPKWTITLNAATGVLTPSGVDGPPACV